MEQEFLKSKPMIGAYTKWQLIRKNIVLRALLEVTEGRPGKYTNIAVTQLANSFSPSYNHLHPRAVCAILRSLGFAFWRTKRGMEFVVNADDAHILTAQAAKIRSTVSDKLGNGGQWLKSQLDLDD